MRVKEKSANLARIFWQHSIMKMHKRLSADMKFINIIWKIKNCMILNQQNLWIDIIDLKMQNEKFLF
uniref:Uncharacterized protein n=1 Tax=Panagrolaimus sp. PS1159 TaxID=55785 RepID=A0AC35GJY7_9BILA